MSANWESDERHCPLPVVRKQWDDDGNEVTLHIEVCGTPLFTEYIEDKYLLAGGECDACGPTWRVTCENGHVLFAPDHEADDNFSLIPYDDLRTHAALAGIHYVISEVALDAQ